MRLGSEVIQSVQKLSWDMGYHKEGIETEMVQLSGKVIEPCKACWCVETKGTAYIRMTCFRRFLKKQCRRI